MLGAFCVSGELSGGKDCAWPAWIHAEVRAKAGRTFLKDVFVAENSSAMKPLTLFVEHFAEEEFFEGFIMRFHAMISGPVGET